MSFTADSFTDTSGTALTSHTGETGATWTAFATLGGSPTAVISDANRARAGSTTCILVASGSATTDGESYAATIVKKDSATARAGILGRADPSTGKGYWASVVESGVVTLRRFDSDSTFPTLATSSAQSFGASNVLKMTVSGTGATVNVKVFWDGTQIVNYDDTAAGRRTSPGRLGVDFSGAVGNTTGIHIDDVDGADPVADSAIITAPTDGRVCQVAGGATGNATISLVGTYTGTAPDQWRVVLDGTSTAISGLDWASFTSAPTGGAFSQTITVAKQSGWLNVQVRNSGLGVVTTSGKVGAGVNVIVDGQSPAWLWFSTTSYAGDSSLTPSDLLRITGKQPGSGWTAPSAATMNGAVSCGNALVTLLGCPVGLIDGSWDAAGLTVDGGSGASGAAGRYVAAGGTAGNATTASHSALTTAGGAAAATIFIQGEQDAGASVTQANYYAGLGQFATLRRTAVGSSSHPIVLVGLGRRTGATDAQYEGIKAAQVQKCADSYIYRVDRVDLPLHTDNVHNTAAGFTTMGQRCAQAVAAALGVVSYYRGPRITTVTLVSAAVFDVNLAFSSPASDFTPTSGITGFRVLDGGTPVSVSSAARQSATSIRLTLASAPAALPVVQYLYGVSPTISGVAVDNATLTLPLEYNPGVAAVSGASSVSLTLTTDGTTPAASLTNLKWAFFDQATPDLLAAPIARGAVESTNASGVLVLDITGTSLPPGSVGWLIVTNSDGTTTQSPAHKLFAGPVTVS